MQIALCMISSEADEAKVRALGEQMRPFVDEVVITVNSPDGSRDFKWNQNFSDARNDNFSRTKADWIIWLDADDTLDHPEKLRTLVAQAADKNISGYYFKYRYAFDKSGNCVDEHWKAQLLKNDSSFKWMGPVHEDPIQQSPVNWIMTDEVVRIHHSDPQRGKSSHDRNLAILEKWHQDDPNEPRAMFYLGRAYTAAKRYADAINILQQYLELSGWDDERYEARLLIGQAYLHSGDVDTALLAYHDAILEKESNPDAYIYKGMCYMRQEKWEEALYNFQIAQDLPLPNAVTFFNPMFYKRDVYQAIAIAKMHTGRLDDALLAIKVALAADKSPDIKELYSLILRLKDKRTAVQRIIDTVKFAEKHDSTKTAQILLATPLPLWDDELLTALRKRFLPPKVWPKGSLVVYCGSSAEDWTPDSQHNGGIGGSETAVIELTKRLAAMGWDVTVYNQGGHPAEGRVYDGVKYLNYWMFNPDDKFDVLWCWRVPMLFDFNLSARLKVLDLHDVMSPADFTEKRINNIDKIFVKTHYHRTLYPKVPDEKFVIVGNGIDLTRFEGEMVKEPLRFCYTSSPNRGLDVLLKMWPKIRDALPDATLHVYYGWKTFYEIEKHNPERMMWMKKVQALMDQPGVVDHGRVGQKELAQDELKTAFWLYPTNFPEIDCITAKEMQAAGVYPITSGYAALAESQQTGIKVPGDIYDPKWQDQYINAVIGTKWEDTREVAKQFSWDIVANTWNNELTNTND